MVAEHLKEEFRFTDSRRRHLRAKSTVCRNGRRNGIILSGFRKMTGRLYWMASGCVHTYIGAAEAQPLNADWLEEVQRWGPNQP